MERGAIRTCSRRRDGPGQAWVADITYVALPGGSFAYLACVLDVFLRRIVGSAMSRRIDGKLTLSALERALASQTPAPGWLHHTDRGSQYLSEDHKKRVLETGGRISCSDKGCPEDNAFIESFFKTLKAEEVWPWRLRELRARRCGNHPVHRLLQLRENALVSGLPKPRGIRAQAQGKRPVMMCVHKRGGSPLSKTVFSTMPTPDWAKQW